MSKICFDIDGVVCGLEKNNDYKKSKPIKKNIKFINKLFDEGYYIILFTARYMGRNNDNIKKAKKIGYKSTLKQLKSWKVKFHKLIFGKPSYDFIIDDKAIFFKKKWTTELNKILLNEKKWNVKKIF